MHWNTHTYTNISILMNEFSLKLYLVKLLLQRFVSQDSLGRIQKDPSRQYKTCSPTHNFVFSNQSPAERRCHYTESSLVPFIHFFVL